MDLLLTDGSKVHDNYISAVNSRLHRPTWSVMIPVCDRLNYLQTALRSVLDQDPGIDKMQICIVDNSKSVIDWNSFSPAVSGKRVEIYKQINQVPAYENFNTCIRKSKGHLVHILHDDDWINAGFYTTIEQAAIKAPSIGIWACRILLHDTDGNLARLADWVPSSDPKLIFRVNLIKPILWCPGIVVRRSSYEKHGGFIGGTSVLDVDMWARVAFSDGIGLLNFAGASYREGTLSATHGLQKDGTMLRHIWQFGNQLALKYNALTLNEVREAVAQLAQDFEGHFAMKGEKAAALAYRTIWNESSTNIQKFERYFNSLMHRLKLGLVAASGKSSNSG